MYIIKMYSIHFYQNQSINIFFIQDFRVVTSEIFRNVITRNDNQLYPITSLSFNPKAAGAWGCSPGEVSYTLLSITE